MNYKDIIIKSSDKGGTNVIMKRQYYIQEGLRQLDNQGYYSP